MKRLSALLLALFLTSLSSSALAGPGFEAGIRGMYWFPDLSATAQTVTAGVAESETLSQDIEFNGQIFPASDNVISSLDVDMIDAELQVDILRPNFVAASFYLGLIAKVKYVDLDLELTSTALTEKEDFQGAVPMIGLAAGVGFLNDLLRVDVRATGMAYSGNHLYEADAFASLVPFPFLRIQGGYRYIDLKADEDDLLADVELSGPYARRQKIFLRRFPGWVQ
jgi:hypothetical protein